MDLETIKTRTHRPLVVVMSFFLAITLFVSALPQYSAGAVTCKFKHKVQQGETLIYIGDLYGVDWLKIADASKLSPPYTITAGQVLCIPEGTKPSGSTTETTSTTAGAILQVSPGLSQVLVSVENFPKKTAYFVRISSASSNVNYRLGQFVTNKEGDFTDWFRVPAFIRRTPQMTLCVKNAWTDKVSCVKYDDISVYIPSLLNPGCSKVGR